MSSVSKKADKRNLSLSIGENMILLFCSVFILICIY